MVPAPSALPNYPQYSCRFVNARERPFPNPEPTLPLVIEPKASGDLAGLKHFLEQNSDDIIRNIYTFGAILFRGFQITEPHHFDDALRSVKPFRTMAGYFMSEIGRELVSGTDHVFETNTVHRTGADFVFGGFHTENYYSVDIPQFQSFCCLKAPWFGGETALVHMANAYRDLDADLRERIEREPALVAAYPVPEIAERYGLPEQTIEEFFRDLGLPVRSGKRFKRVLVFKPNVYRHPHHGTGSLQVNLSMEVPGFKEALMDRFAPMYSEKKWIMHRLAWRNAAAEAVLRFVTHVPRNVKRPGLLFHNFRQMLQLLAARRVNESVKIPLDSNSLRFQKCLETADVSNLADAIWNHVALFTWQPGDVLIFDGLQTLHGGMPGLGPRDLKVQMFNPLPLKYPLLSGSYDAMPGGQIHESVDSRLKRLARTLNPSTRSAD